MSGGDGKTTGPISPELFWNEIRHISDSISRIEKAIAKLPCDDLGDRIARLEEFRAHQEKTNDKAEEAIDGAYALARTSQQDTFNRFWKLGIVFLGSILTVAQGYLLYLLTGGGK